MTDLTSILGGPWSPPSEAQPTPPEEQLRQAMLDAGLDPPEHIQLDGRIHRFRSGTKGRPGHDKAGWYIAFADGVPAGRFGCWRAGIEQTWRADIRRQLSPAEEAAYQRRLEEARRARDEELARQHAAVAETVARIWAEAPAASPEHPYLKRKRVQPHGARVSSDGRLIVPLYSPDGRLSSCQYIAHDGSKLYHPGGRVGGCYWMLGTMDEPGLLYVAEGVATAASVHETSGRPCVVAYSASNLVPVLGALRERYGAAQDIIIVADHDASGVGQRYAEQAVAKYGGRYVMPPTPGDANDYAQSGGDLASLLSPPAEEEWLVPADDFAEKPAPISWLVKHWIQDNALMMVHGPSGAGKTFVVLDWALRIASGMGEWCGHKVAPGCVVYLAGEGHHGLRGRIAAWKHHHQPQQPLKLWLSRGGCDLNTPGGYMRVAESIRRLPETPRMIVVDTLHRFLAGDENSAQDARSMLDACARLMDEFDCSVLLVHHTGVSDEAQHRARGSSAWRAALDIEISVMPGKDGEPMQIVQRKAKDSETAKPIAVELHQIAIPGWIDDDGEQVTSAVVIEAVMPTAPAKKGRSESKISVHLKIFEAAWWASEAEERQGKPYVSRSAMLEHLTERMGMTAGSAAVYVKPSATGRLIADLLIAGVIEAHEHGWVVVDATQASAMLVRKSGR